jgi:hypothetical protein
MGINGVKIKRLMNVRKKVKLRKEYSGCQKNVPLSQRFFLQPLIPQFIVSELYYGKRYIANHGPKGFGDWAVFFKHKYTRY